MPRTRGLALALALAILVVTASAAAETPAEIAYREGRAALRDKRPEEAQAAFAKGLANDPEGELRFRLLLGAALAHEAMGRDASAWQFYRAFLIASSGEQEGDWAKRRARVDKDLTALRTKLDKSHGEVEIRSSPAGAALSLDGDPLPRELSTPVTLFVPPGSHEIALSGRGRVAVKTDIDVTAGERLVVDRSMAPVPVPEEPGPATVEPKPAPPPPSPAKAAPVTQPSPKPLPPTPERDDLAFTIVGASLAGLGAGAVVTGGVLAGLVRSDLDEMNDLRQQDPSAEVLQRDAELRSRLATREGASVALLVTGSLMAAAGVVTLLLVELDTDTEVAEAALGVGPTGLDLRLRF